MADCFKNSHPRRVECLFALGRGNCCHNAAIILVVDRLDLEAYAVSRRYFSLLLLALVKADNTQLRQFYIFFGHFAISAL